MIAHAETTSQPPAWKEAVERLLESEDSIKATYDAATVDPLNPIARGIFPSGADADTHYPSEFAFFLPIERARNAVRNNGLVEQGIRRLNANLQLDEVTIDIDSGDDAIDKDLKAWHGDWASRKSECDYEGFRTLGEMADQSMFSQVVDGDIVHLPLQDGRIQTFEAHHLRNPVTRMRGGEREGTGIVHGVEMRNGRVAAYHLTPQDVSVFNLGSGYRTERYEAWDEYDEPIVFHLGFRHRFSMRRGTSRLSPARSSMNGFDQLNWAHIHSALRRSLIAFVQMDASPQVQNPLSGGLPQTGERYQETDGVSVKTYEKLGSTGAIFNAAPGKKIEGWQANMPGSGFFDQAALLLSIFAVNIDLPLSFLLLDGSLANFHGGRMVADQARLRFRKLQRMQIEGLYEPVYRWRVRQRITPGTPQYDPALANAVRRRGADPFAATFRAKGWPYPKPAEDVAARDTAESRNLKSLRRILAEDGIDLDDEMEEIVRDRGQFARRSLREAIEIAKEFPEARLDVGQLFREFWHGSNPSGTQLAIAGAQQQTSEQEEDTMPSKRGAA